ncbi:MAG: hypothetical protein H0T76_27880 [Nannocystis sp.]|nr:hypothetical protein [Nannocystis sp.]MBA3550313.1 hypothetical protein [Nannocystis sp.]
MSDNASTAPGRLYRVGKHWYVDTALLQGIARRLTVEPMQGGYQILAPAGLVRCTSASGLALPGQTGALYRCQGQKPEQDIGARLRKLAGALGADALGGEWEQWPTGALTPAPAKTGCASCSAAAPAKAACGCASCSGAAPKKTACGCTECQSGGACSCGGAPHTHETEPQSFLERLIVSETLGTVRPQILAGGAIVLYPAQHGAPAWACGRYHECIASILRFPDVAEDEWIAVTEFRQGKLAIRWGVVLDRQRTLMLGEILQMVARLADRAARTKSLTPAAPSKHTPGFGAWEMAIEMTRRNGFCERCPYRLGSNLRCPGCRQVHRHPTANAAQETTIARILGEQAELRTTPPSVLKTLAQAIATSNANNPNEPLSDRFFVQLERDVLLALQPLGLGTRETEAVLEIAELLPFDAQIAVGAAARQEAA